MRRSQHELQRICPRCKSWNNCVAPPLRVNGAIVNINGGMKTTRYLCKECYLVFEEAD